MSVLSGKGALVTGGSRGIGRAVVERLVADGADVAFSYRADAERAGRVAEETGALPVRADQARKEDLERLFGEAEKRLPGIDIVVMNAAEVGRGLIAEASEETYEQVFAVNARAMFLAVRWAAGVMRDGGRIINVSTLNTAIAAPGVGLYAASKAAAEQFVKVAARELGGRGITANTVSPGATDTDMLHAGNSPEALAQVPAFTALGRIGRPDDIASVIAFLAGPDGRWITGQNILATGGMIL
ncbi:3-oxoacyl-[acyl-carrier protein] reductase [Nonomuraea muscovyensis]|uniref:3-oxoacyl-[acyl-carrier protein] reductase n=1 Tax=Nonomuraea muscovyensis TaxID=1124761 RepID=A0A7X0C7V9_9ACTN|nr:SDR family oxidoreductase [Nonomuraea muscovyensis]MBB6349748.1 3-oxoacyl-[acyl-carrier protein] reductase [Nonomuraea muscovyensis]